MLELPPTKFIEIGIDEAGRGTLVGPVIAAAVIMPSIYTVDDTMIGMIKDSKKLTPKKREMLATYIKKTAIAYGIGSSSAKEIDDINILQSSYVAMHRALDQVIVEKKIMFDTIVVDGSSFKAYLAPEVDGYKFSNEWVPYSTIVNGDNIKINIAAASILAKVHHDAIIHYWVAKQPDLNDKYGFSTNLGYGTKKHMAGIIEYGVLPEHRRSFAPVSRYIANNN